VIAWLAGNMVWATAAMLVVLLIRRPVTAWLGAGAAYALWLAPALRMVAPPGPWLAAIAGPAVPALAPIELAFETDMAAPAAATGGVPWLGIALLVWASGALLFLVYQALAYRAFLTRLSLSLRSAGSHKGVPLMESEAVEGPLALGLLDRRIVTPADFGQRYTAAERALALDHEAYHHRRLDLLANHVALVLLALHWFNPVAWLAFRAFRADQELSCDAAVTASASAETRADYARALIKSASRPGLIAACPLNHADQLKRRLKMMNRHKHNRARLFGGAAVTAGLIVVSMALGAPGHAREQDKDKGQRRERVIIMEHRDGAERPAGERGERREFMMRRHGEGGGGAMRALDPELAARIEACRDEGNEVAINEGEGDERVQLRLCTHGEGGTPAGRADALARARARIAENDELSAETRQRILSRLDQEIARIRGN
jgi:beta-lactamase regulating signal transducer with metallopeptidase domain